MNKIQEKRLSEAENILKNVLSTLEEWFETEEERGSIYLEIKEFLNTETEENNFENWLTYMQNNTIFDLSELLEFKDHYQNGLSNAQNGNLFYEFAEDDKKCLFENYAEQPQVVSEILSRYELEEMDYNTCENLLKELNAIGYTFDYGLSAEPFNLRKILK